MQMYAHKKEHMKEVIDCVFALFAWFNQEELLAGIAKTATGKAYNECKTLGWLSKYRDTILFFPNGRFLDSGCNK